jgi:hypothetical protein
MCGKHWTKEEEQFLIENYGDKEKMSLLNRSASAIIGKAITLNVKDPKKWTDAQVKILQKNYSNHHVSQDELVEMIGKPLYAIQMKANKLGLKRRELSKEDEQTIRSLYDGSMASLDKISKIIGRSSVTY